MPKEILEYIDTQRVGVLAVEMLDGSPHGATVHFANTKDPIVFYFKTSSDYKKSEVLLGREQTRASFVVGSSEADMRTLQLDGIAELIKPEEKELYDSSYFGKFPEKKNKPQDFPV